MDVAVVGIGIHPFGRHEGVTALQMGAHAGREALRDAGLQWSDMPFVAGGSLGFAIHGGPTPDTVINELGLTGLQFANVFNGCATAATALETAANAIQAGRCDVAMAIGLDKHPRGHFNAEAELAGHGSWFGELGLMVTTQFFAMKLVRYMHDHGITEQALARVAAKAFRNGSLNPNAWRQQTWTEEEILASRMLNYPLTQYMFCSPDEGAAALVLCRADQAHRYTSTPVYLRSVAMRTRKFGTFEVYAPWLAPETVETPVSHAARACFEQAGIGPEDVDIAQLQDSESGAEIMHMAETGLCKDGEQEALLAEGATEIGGRLPINTDGGLIANGEPIGASGMRQFYETVLQLRGQAGARQVPGSPKVGFTQVYGAPGIGACALFST